MTIFDTLTLAVVGRLCAARVADGMTHAAVAGPNLITALGLDCPELTDQERLQVVIIIRDLVDAARAVSVGSRMELELHHPIGGGAA